MTCCGPAWRSSRPSPLSSGSAKWNLLAPYAVKSDGGRNSAGRDRLCEQVGAANTSNCGPGRDEKPPTSSSRAAVTC